MTPDVFDEWLRKVWHQEAWAKLEVRNRGESVLRPYAPEALADLAVAYKALSNAKPPWTTHLDGALRNYPDFVLRAHIPRAWPSSGLRAGVYSREFPLPTYDSTPGLLPADASTAPFHRDIMVESIAAVRAGNQAYRTLRTGLVAAQTVIEHVGGVAVDKESFIDNVVISDWVKLFALFAHEDAMPFPSERAPVLSKRSVHARTMYKYAAPLFAEEVTEQLNLNFLVIFGPTNLRPAEDALVDKGWKKIVATDGRGNPIANPAPRMHFDPRNRNFIVLPHPSAVHGALRKALKFLVEVER